MTTTIEINGTEKEIYHEYCAIELYRETAYPGLR